MRDGLPQHAVVIVFVGLPGAGKTSLARALAAELKGIGFEGTEFSAKLWRVCLLNFGQLEIYQPALFMFIRRLCKNSSEEEYDAQESRQCCLERVGRLSKSSWDKQIPAAVLVDDNMFYRSMRKQVLLTARAGRASFMQLYVPATLDQAQQNNLKRPPLHQVHADVINSMHEKLQAPDSSRNSWERPTVTWKGNLDSSSDLHELVDSMGELWGEQLKPNSCSSSKQAAQHPDETPCHRSLLHELDVASRKLLSQVRTSLCTLLHNTKAVAAQQLAGEDIQRLNAQRREMMQQARGLEAGHLEEAWAAFAASFARTAGLVSDTHNATAAKIPA